MLDTTHCRFYAAERWANAVYAVSKSRDDPRTVTHWGRLVGASRSTLSTWCRAVGLSPRHSLELARLIRALLATHGQVALLQQVLDISEPRTLNRLLQRAGLPADRTNVVVAEFVATQRLVSHPIAINELLALLQCPDADGRSLSA